MAQTLSKTETSTPIRSAPTRTVKAPANPARPSDYIVARVEKADVPDGAKGHWYRYVLDNGRSTIAGQRKGSYKDVMAHAQRYAQQLNARSLGAPSVWAPRKPDASKIKPRS